jgi:hypothetical protein
MENSGILPVGKIPSKHTFLKPEAKKGLRNFVNSVKNQDVFFVLFFWYLSDANKLFLPF